MNTYETPHAAAVARMLLEIKAIRLNPDKPFKWASGWNSPIYCDNRLSLSFPKVRTYIKRALADLVQEKFPSVEAIAGVATAGIPQGALVADVLGLPFLYVRPKPKEHGLGNQIEGQLLQNQRVVLVEDLISTGGSSLKAAEAIEAAGGVVLGMTAIFTYGFGIAEQNFSTKNVRLYSLSNYTALLEEAIKMEYINENQLQTLSEWRQNPADWRV
ncbi:MAG: orotate phosphoribosyltransferase [Spirosomataceae bacterium]